MSVSIQIDQASLDNLNKQFEKLKLMGPRTLYSSLNKIAFKIVNEAKMRIRGRNHIVTGRLRNSIFVKTDQKPVMPYQDNNGISFVADLQSVGIGKDDLAIGTNVEYAGKIEAKDSFLLWAVRNVDISKSVQDDMQKNLENAMKFGSGIL